MIHGEKNKAIQSNKRPIRQLNSPTPQHPSKQTNPLSSYFKQATIQAIRKFKNQALDKRNLKYLLYYATVNFAILILYTLYERSQPAVLDLRPVTSPQVEGSFLLFIVSVALLPLSLFLEEAGFRLLPMIFFRDVFHLNTITVSIEHDGKVTEIYHSRLRWWLYHNWWILFIVASASWTAWIHQLNIIESSPVGAVIYFAVQFFSGACFSWLYLKRGLGCSWIVHLGWDGLLIGLNLIILLL